jgi:hypothetical protein
MKFLLTIFLLSVVVVLYSMIAVNLDLFIYSALIADIVGITAIVYSFKYNKQIV